MELTKPLTGKDVVSRSFATKSRRGYDPREVDTFLDDVAMSLDLLHEQVATLELQLEARPSSLAPPSAPAEPVKVAAEAPAPSEPEPEPAPTAPVAEPDAAERESLELVLRMAQKTAEEAIGEANVRSDEILAEARFQAAQIGREADKKAFEAATNAKSELEEVENKVSVRSHQLEDLGTQIAMQRARIQDLADELRGFADRVVIDADTPVLDLTAPAAAEDNAELNGHEPAVLGSVREEDSTS